VNSICDERTMLIREATSNDAAAIWSLIGPIIRAGETYTLPRDMSEADALSCVLGYTVGNDVSERVWQKSDRTLWRAKNADTFKPMGPWIDTDVDLDALETRIRLNGRETLRFRTNAMIFGVAKYISTMSRYLTLYPGDVIWMGTDGSSPDLQAGDVVEVEITAVGTLRNPFIAEA